jgi:hypothetical protein
MQTLFVRLTKLGYLAPLVPVSQEEAKTARVGWIMTPAGVERLFFTAYTDISRARDQFGLSAGRLKSFGLQEPVIVNINSQRGRRSIEN